MRIEGLCDVIESYEMSARVNVASDLRTAIDIGRSHPVVRELSAVLDKPGVAEKILRRVFQLATRATDVRYENPDDVALMLYAWLLDEYDPELALMASAAICGVPNLWWASRVAAQILEQRHRRNEMACEVSGPVMVNADAGDRVLVADLRFSFPTMLRLLRGMSSPGFLGFSNVQTTVDPRGLPVELKNDSAAELSGRIAA